MGESGRVTRHDFIALFGGAGACSVAARAQDRKDLASRSASPGQRGRGIFRPPVTAGRSASLCSSRLQLAEMASASGLEFGVVVSKPRVGYRAVVDQRRLGTPQGWGAPLREEKSAGSLPAAFKRIAPRRLHVVARSLNALPAIPPRAVAANGPADRADRLARPAPWTALGFVDSVDRAAQAATSSVPSHQVDVRRTC
jgi:hypothetical protein